MNQEYLDHLFQNYTGVENWHFTSDGTAFKNMDDAFKHAGRLEDNVVKRVANGGNIEEAVTIDAAGEVLSTDEVAVLENKEEDHTQFTVAKLREFAELRNIDLGKLTKKNDILALIESELAKQRGEMPNAENTNTENTGTENTNTENPGTENTNTENTGTENTGTENSGTENTGE